jgi:hypothetical protein
LIEVKDIRLINRSHSLKNGYMADFEYLPVYGVHRDETGIMCDFTLSLTLHSSDNIKRTILNVFEKIGIKPEQIRYVKSTYSVYQYVTVEYWPNNAELILGPNSTIEVKKLELNLLNYDIRTALFDLYLEDKNWRLTNLFYFENPSETYPLMFTIEYWDKAKK